MSSIEQSAADGRVVQVNVSPGGVPKLPVDRAWVGELGLEGDAHHDFTSHGGPHRAVCLFSIEAIERLQAEGHPVEPGSVGENLTTTGIEWSLLPVGTMARIGDELVLELSSLDHAMCDPEAQLQRRQVQPHPDRQPSVRQPHVRPRGPRRRGPTGRPDRRSLPPEPDSRAQDLSILYRLDRAEAKSAVAAWQAAAEAGYEIHIFEDGDIAMAAAPRITGPGFNHAVGFAQVPNLISMATDFYDRHGTEGWLITDTPPWPDAERDLAIAVFAAAANDVPIVAPPRGVTFRLAGAVDGPAVEEIYDAAEATGVASDATANPWPAVYTRLAEHPHRFIVLAEIDGEPVGVSSLHTHSKTGWLRGAAVVPDARGRGIQRAMISARVALAIEHGCDLVGAWAEPNGFSSANLEQLGLRQIGTSRPLRVQAAAAG